MEESNLSEQRKFMKKSDLLVILVLAGVFLGGWFWMRSRGAGATEENYAVLSINDQVLEVWPLAEHHNDLTVDLASYGFPGKAEFHDGAVRVVDVDCPDKVCESMGYVKNEMEAVVCLPNRMSIIIYTPEEYRNLTGEE